MVKKCSLSTISSSVLFHFSGSIINLKNILSEEAFRPHYVIENYEILFGDQADLKQLAFPMGCFCDIPLSLIRDHICFYGSYGIGLSKEWGFKNGITPVLYFYLHSFLAQRLKRIYRNISSITKGQEKEQWVSDLTNILSFVKPYEGEAKHKNSDQIFNKRFYDEREWRYVPDLSKTDLRPCLAEDEFSTIYEKNSQLQEMFKLKFYPEDIKYIVVEEDEQILEMLKFIDETYLNCDKNHLAKLKSRIITKTQIESDF